MDQVLDLRKNVRDLMGSGPPDENAHAPSERIDRENFHLGIKSAPHLATSCRGSRTNDE